MKITVTGSSGFIGRHLCRRLSEGSNITVTGTDLRENPDAEYNEIIGDLTAWDFVATLPDADLVVHLSAYNKTHAFYSKPYTVIENTMTPTMNLLRRYQTCRKFVYSSSSEVYAGGVSLGLIQLPTDASTPLIIDDIRNPRWSYAASKIMGEAAVIAAHKQFGMPYLIIRYHNVYGPGQTDHFIPEYFQRARNGDIHLPGAHQTRSFTYVADAVSVTERVIFDKTNEIIHIVNPKEFTILEVAKVINRLADITTDPIPEPPRPGSVDRRAAVGVLPDYPYIDLEEGIAKTLTALRNDTSNMDTK